MIDFTPVKRRSISSEITAQILEQILGGLIEPGQKLPPERELAARFNTNRNTLREAIRNLQTLNVVEARQGDGLRVLDFAEAGEINLLPHFIRHAASLEARVAVLEDMLRLRRILLAEVCGLLSTSASPQELDALFALIQQQRDNRDDPEKLVRTDLEISLAMVSASGSLAYKWIFNTMAKLYREIAFQFPWLWIFTPAYVESLETIVEAARNGDGETARKVMAKHLEESDELILNAVRALADAME